MLSTRRAIELRLRSPRRVAIGAVPVVQFPFALKLGDNSSASILTGILHDGEMFSRSVLAARSEYWEFRVLEHG
jgi:hypothetical protein